MKKSKKQVVLSVTAKCSDRYSHTVKHRDGKEVEYHGYVPSFFPGQHFGDYLMLDIDPYTGKILNWKRWLRAGRDERGRFRKLKRKARA